MGLTIPPGISVRYLHRCPFMRFSGGGWGNHLFYLILKVAFYPNYSTTASSGLYIDLIIWNSH